MSLSFYTGYAQNPNAAPTVTGASAGIKYLVAYRILVRGGQWSAISPYSGTGYAFPMSVTAPIYYGNFEAYQILISSDGGVNWRLAYSGTERTRSFQAFDSGWVITSPATSVAPGLALLDFGTFSSTVNPSVVIYAKALAPTSNIQIGATRTTGQNVPELFGKLQIEYLGKYAGQVGTGVLDASEATGIVYDHPYLSSNNLPVDLSTDEVGAFRLSLIAYDSANPISSADTIQLSLEAGANTYPLPLAPRQASKGLLFDSLPIYESTDLVLTLKPFRLARYGAVISVPKQAITLPASSTTSVYVASDGSLTLSPTGFSLGKFTTSGTAVTGFTPEMPWLPDDTRIGIAGAAVEFGDVLAPDFTPGGYIGVALHDAASGERVEYSAKGPTWCKTSSTFTVGQQAWSTGTGSVSNSGPGASIGVSLSPTINGYVVVEISPVISAVGGSTNLGIASVTSTTLDVTSSTGSAATVPAATTSLAGLMTAADKTRLGILDNLGTGFTGSTIPDGATLEQALQSLETAVESGGGGGGGYSNEQAVDAAAAALVAGTHTGISFTYDDANNKINAAVTGGGDKKARFMARLDALGLTPKVDILWFNGFGSVVPDIGPAPTPSRVITPADYTDGYLLPSNLTLNWDAIRVNGAGYGLGFSRSKGSESPNGIFASYGRGSTPGSGRVWFESSTQGGAWLANDVAFTLDKFNPWDIGGFMGAFTPSGSWAALNSRLVDSAGTPNPVLPGHPISVGWLSGTNPSLVEIVIATSELTRTETTTLARLLEGYALS